MGFFFLDRFDHIPTGAWGAWASPPAPTPTPTPTERRVTLTPATLRIETPFCFYIGPAPVTIVFADDGLSCRLYREYLP